jgi:phthiocerol/phenolphthiocerol synthesis type-I polyketide synthase D
VRQPVRFTHAITAAAENHGTFIEISPHPLLTHAITDTLESSSSTDRRNVTSAMKRGEDETVFFHMQLASIDATNSTSDGGRLADVPPSPWLHSEYWIEPRSPRQATGTHPLLGVHVEMPSGRDHVWQADIGTELMPWPKINGQIVMPVAAFAEMTLAAGSHALNLPVGALEVNDLEVQHVLVLDDQTRVTTQLTQGADGNRVEIHASSGGGTWSRYAVASIGVNRGDVPAERADIGPGTEIVLPDDAADHPGYLIHPALLDAALQQLAAAIPAESPDASTHTPYVPVSVTTIRVYGPIRYRTRCHVDLVEQEPGRYSGRIVLSDDNGSPVAELAGVELRPVDPRALSLTLAQKVFETTWSQSPAPRTEAAPPAGSWLVLTDTDAETQALAAEFATRLSSPHHRVISHQLSDGSGLEESVATAAGDPELPPVGVVVLVGDTSFDGTDSDAALSRARDLIWSVSVAARTAVVGWTGHSPRLWVVTRNGLAVHGDEPGDPAIGALKGLIRTWRFPGELARVLAEEPDLDATLVDFDMAGDAVATLVTELSSSAGDDVVAWRKDRRYVERLSRAVLDADAPVTVVRNDASYIITGGLGGLGMVVARWLIERGAGRLILNGRTDPSDDQRKVLAELEDGAEIAFIPGDIASPDVAKQLLAAAEQSGHQLRGVVHAAGVLDDNLVSALTQENLERVWAAKVTGALRLHAATASCQLDWWLGFSSMASLLGLPGQAAYATANAWLDALVAWRHASGLPATAIDWGQWSDVGMGRSVALSVLDPIAPDEGVEALQSLVGGPLARVGVARLRLDRALTATPEFRELGYFADLISEFDGFHSPTADHPSAAPDAQQAESSAPEWSQLSTEDRRSELQARLAAILARELRTPASAVQLDQPFPELGLDSMMAMTVLRETQKMVGIELSANMLFNHPTITSLATYVAELLAPEEIPQEQSAELAGDSASVLDELFDSVESASAGSESGIF